MARVQRQSVRQFLAPVFLGLELPGIDKVQAGPVENRIGDIPSLQGLGGAVAATQKPQRLVVQRLHAQRDAIDPGIGKGLKLAAFDGGRVGLQRDLYIVGG